MLDELITGCDDDCPVFVHSELMPILIANQTIYDGLLLMKPSRRRHERGIHAATKTCWW